MRRVFLFTIFIFVSFIAMCGVFIPPGTVKANDSLFVDIAEISNVDWREYMYWNKKVYGDASEQYKYSVPDTAVWRTSIYEQVAKSYFTHPAYNDYPIVGISFEQANAYCEWRSGQVNYYIYIKENKKPFVFGADTTGIPQIYKYRLPTKYEWEAFAAVGFSNKTRKQIASKKNFHPNLYNLIYTKVEGKNAANAMNLSATSAVKTFWPNALGCYNVFGNVAEMTAQKGLAKGGAWVHNSLEVVLERDFDYRGRQNWVGFRCVCEKIIKSEKELAADSLKMVKIQKQITLDSIKIAKTIKNIEPIEEIIIDSISE